jgi:hypothetical protein
MNCAFRTSVSWERLSFLRSHKVHCWSVNQPDTVPVISCSYESDVPFASRSGPTCCWHGSVLTGSCCMFARKRVRSLNSIEFTLNDVIIWSGKVPAYFSWCIHIFINVVLRFCISRWKWCPFIADANRSSDRKYHTNGCLLMWDFKFSRRREWSSELSSGMHYRVK